MCVLTRRPSTVNAATLAAVVPTSMPTISSGAFMTNTYQEAPHASRHGYGHTIPVGSRQADLEMVLDGKVPPTGVHLPSFDLSGDPTVLVAPGHPTGCGSARWPGRWHTKTALAPCR